MQVIKFHIVKAILVILFLFSGCGNSEKSFVDLLYQLAEIKEEDREEVIQSRLEKKEQFPIIENDKVYFIYQNKKNRKKGKYYVAKFINVEQRKHSR